MKNEVFEVDNIYYKEQLFTKNSINIIVNADDLGICKQRDEAIFELYSKGIVSSSSILANGINFENSIRKAKLINMPLGLHLNLTEGTPTNQKEIKNNSLVVFEEETNSYVMHGKFEFRKKLNEGKINLNDIKYEIISQILKFLEYYEVNPSHIDGHQHVHVIPEIATILAESMCNFGIYRTRLPIENIKNLESLQIPEKILFYKRIIEQTIICREIYNEYNISYPDKFIGLSLMGRNLTEDNFNKIIKEIYSENYSANQYREIFVEYMCHPGYIPTNFFWDEFNSSDDRIYEKETIETIFSKQNISFKLKNFYDVPSKIDEKYNILILGNLTYGTGNYITSLRIQNILKNLNYNCYLFNIININKAEGKENQANALKKLKSFIINNKIHAILGIHILRSGSVLNLLIKDKEFPLKIPYCLITSGTDANQFVNSEYNMDLMIASILGSEKIISFNEEMIIKLEEKLGEIKNKVIIPQSMLINKESTFSMRTKLKIPENYKVSLFPSGIRRIKDIKFILNELLDLLEEHQNHVIVLIGAVLEIDYYDEIVEVIQAKSYTSSKRFFIENVVEHRDFINILKESDLVLNSSISEGMSNALLESMKVGIPVLAKNNEGNRKLIDNNRNGLLFDSAEEFKVLYKKIYNEEIFRKKLIENAKNTVDSNFNINSEIEKYKSIIEDMREKYYKDYKNLKLYFPDKVHPFSEENNELFESIDYKGQSENINILDIGCGAGIFSFILLLKNRHITVNELVLMDIQDNSLYSSYQNFIHNKHMFRINKITIIKSDLFGQMKQEFNNYFDLVLANMPQTPNLNIIRSKIFKQVIFS